MKTTLSKKSTFFENGKRFSESLKNDIYIKKISEIRIDSHYCCFKEHKNDENFCVYFLEELEIFFSNLEAKTSVINYLMLFIVLNALIVKELD